MDYKIFWTNEAINNLEEILDFLIKKWSQREVDNFKKSLAKKIQIIQRFPQILVDFDLLYRNKKNEIYDKRTNCPNN
jgi:plasmid stabilization system protein ParE